MKAVQPSYLHLSNILLGRVGFSGRVFGSGYRVKLLNPTRVLGFNFSTRPDTFPKEFQPDPTRSVYVRGTEYTAFNILHMKHRGGSEVDFTIPFLILHFLKIYH